MRLTSGNISASTERSIGWLVFDNPGKLNALSSAMSVDALEVLDSYQADPAVKVVIVRGAGTRAFTAGGDIKELEVAEGSKGTPLRSRQLLERLRLAMGHLEKPLIAMIHGYCFGGGLALALEADLRFASADAQFSVPAALRGIAYAPAALKSLVDLIGPSRAKDIMFSARRLNADEALSIGLINRVAGADDLESVTVEYAERLAENAPLSIRASKFFIRELAKERAERDEARMEAMQREAEDSEDFREATLSFLENRKPVFRGR